MSRLIDADALKYAIVEEGQRSRRYKLGDFWELNGDEIRNVIDAQPTIKPERKTGMWIERGLSGMVCSSCGYEYECKGTDSENYCPNCGSYNGGEV